MSLLSRLVYFCRQAYLLVRMQGACNAPINDVWDLRYDTLSKPVQEKVKGDLFQTTNTIYW